jgi:hypothetical protein
MVSSRVKCAWAHFRKPQFFHGLLTPEIDEQNENNQSESAPRYHNDLDPQFANGLNVLRDIWILVKEPVTISKNIYTPDYIDEQEERCRYSQGRKSYRIDLC